MEVKIILTVNEDCECIAELYSADDGSDTENVWITLREKGIGIDAKVSLEELKHALRKLSCK